jgi:hypothetical protein
VCHQDVVLIYFKTRHNCSVLNADIMLQVGQFKKIYPSSYVGSADAPMCPKYDFLDHLQRTLHNCVRFLNGLTNSSGTEIGGFGILYPSVGNKRSTHVVRNWTSVVLVCLSIQEEYIFFERVETVGYSNDGHCGSFVSCILLPLETL